MGLAEKHPLIQTQIWLPGEKKNGHQQATTPSPNDQWGQLPSKTCGTAHYDDTAFY